MTLERQLVEPSALVERVTELKTKGLRFVTLTALVAGDQIEILYHFADDLALVHLSLHVAPGGKVPSISPVFLAAVLVENEIQDQFGIAFDGIAVDYNRRFYLDEDVTTVPLTSKIKLAPAGG